MQKGKELSVEDRIGLIDDCFTLGESGDISITQAFEMCLKLATESEYIVWAELCSKLLETAHLYQEQPFYRKFCAFMQRVCVAKAEELGWDSRPGEDQRVNLWRSSVLNILRLARHPPTIQEALRRFQTTDVAKLSPDLRLVIFRIAVSELGMAGWDAMRDIYRKSQNPDLKRHAMIALGASSEHSVIDATIEFALGPEVRSQDISTVFAGLCNASYNGRERTWQKLRSSYVEWFDKYSSGIFVWASLIESIVQNFSTFDRLKEIEDFFAQPTIEVGTAQRKLRQGLEKVADNSRRLAAEGSVAGAWLDQNDFKEV